MSKGGGGKRGGRCAHSPCDLSRTDSAFVIERLAACSFNE